jgi:hypothetical protein
MKIPYISLLRGNSYIENCSFGVEQDPQMASLWMSRKLSDTSGVTRKDITSSTDFAINTDKISPQQIFSPMINGKITMIGNFVFNVFGLLWLDFGVPQWNGPFNIMSIEDVVEKGKFSTTIDVYAASLNPLSSSENGSITKRDIKDIGKTISSTIGNVLKK